MKWPSKTFSHLYLVPSRNGLNRPSRDRGEGYKMVNMGELFANDRIGNIPMERVQMNDSELEQCTLCEGDLLFARQSLVLEGAGKCSFVTEITEPTTFESHLIRVRLDKAKADPLFYYYLFTSPYSGMSTIVQQCAQAGIRGSDLSNLSVLHPPLEAQQKIAKILSAYDDLIENNNRRIALLDQAARHLFEEWFVRLNFPGHERNNIIDGVPKRWERKTLSEMAQVNERTLPGSYQGDIEYVDIASVTPGNIGATTIYDVQEAPSRARRVARHGDIIWSCVRPNRRSYAVIWHPPPNLIVSTGFAVITPMTVPTTYLYFATTHPAFVAYLENRATGVAYPAVLSGDFECAPVLRPPHALVTSFNEVGEPILQQSQNLRIQNQKLRYARDLLLPRLMSGEIAA